MNFMRNPKSLFSIMALSTLLGVTGCSTVNPYSGQTETSDATKGSVIGTAGGAIVGGLLGGGRGALIGGAVGAVSGGLIGNSFDKENAELRQTLVGTGVQVNQIGNSIQLVMASDVTFNTASSNINSNFYPTLNSVAIVLKKYSNTSIVISGYTDNVGGDAYNQRLSEARASSVGAYLISQTISPNRIFTQGYGKRYPLAGNATAEGRSQNRRVVITLRPQ